MNLALIEPDELEELDYVFFQRLVNNVRKIRMRKKNGYYFKNSRSSVERRPNIS